MAAQSDTYDAIIVGASLAGCTTAILLARAGASVLLVEQRHEIDAHKVVCGHYIQSSALPTIERLGFYEPMMAAGAVRSPIRMWFDDQFIEPLPADVLAPSINLPRRKLDPIVRRAAAETNGVELRLATSLESIKQLGRDGAAVTLSPAGGSSYAVRAKLLVGADGRDSKVAELAKVRARRSKNTRFNYSPFFTGPTPPGHPAATSYFMGDDWYGSFPTSDGQTGYYLMPAMAKLPDYKADLEGACRAAIRSLPEDHNVDALELSGPIVGRIELSNQWRKPIGDGFALVGDAAIASDPLPGVGCGWAFESGAMLADAVAPALTGDRKLSSALSDYRGAARSRILPHTIQISTLSRRGALSPMEKFIMRRAARNEVVSGHFLRMVSRNVSPLAVMLSPSANFALLRA